MDHRSRWCDLLGYCLVSKITNFDWSNRAGFTGSVSAGVKEITDGAKIYFDSIYAKGGVNEQKINSFNTCLLSCAEGQFMR